MAVHGCRFGFDVSDSPAVIPVGGGAVGASLGEQMNVGAIGGQVGSVAVCGDGIVLGTEDCDDAQNPPQDGDGCSSSCRIESGYGCTGQPSQCTVHDCGNGVTEGDETCDEGVRNGVYYGDGSGCTKFCTQEPDCRGGGPEGCLSDCGDGMRVASEECDDGNVADGDGCSSACAVEAGFSCTTESFTDTQPCSYNQAKQCLQLPVIYRDFIAAGDAGGHDDMLITGNVRSTGEEITFFAGLCQNMVAETLDAQGKPELKGDYNGCEELGGILSITSAESFRDWYAKGHPMMSTHFRSFELERSDTTGTYQFLSTALFPLDGLTRNGELEYCDGDPYEDYEPLGPKPCSQQHNYHFTSEVRYVFRYQGGEVFDFLGDDDLYVFVNGKKALDLGGVHRAHGGTVNLDDQGLIQGNTYEIAIFHAERSPGGSTYRLTLSGFEVERTTSCTPL